MNEARVTVHLTAEEIDSFKLWRQHQDLFAELLEGQVFQTTSGQVTLLFNSEGKVMEIRREIKTFKR